MTRRRAGKITEMPKLVMTDNAQVAEAWQVVPLVLRRTPAQRHPKSNPERGFFEADFFFATRFASCD